MDVQTPSQSSSEDDSLLKGSALYREFLAEREEILRHKWLQSEARGNDVGFENALLDWMVNHRSAWYSSRREA